ncbi:MAG: hypothetical protein AB7I50_24455 [Vicinamibacterales bacterium]
MGLAACGSDGDDAVQANSSVAATTAAENMMTSPDRVVTSLFGQPFFPGEFPGDLIVTPITSGATHGGSGADRRSWMLRNATGKRSVLITAGRSLAATAPGPVTAMLPNVRPGITVELTESKFPATVNGPESIVIAWWVEGGFGVRVAMGGLTEEEQREVIAAMAPASG